MNRDLIYKISTYFLNQPIERAWLFGSYARYEESKNSDIDILVDFIPDAKVTLFKYIHIVNDLQAMTGKMVDLVEDGQLKAFIVNGTNIEKVLIYERKAQRS